MYSMLQPLPHWRDADIKDIERELIDWLIRNPAAIDADSMARIQRNDYEFRWALAHPDRLFEFYAVRIYGVRTMLSNQWTALKRSRGIRSPDKVVDVRWSYSKLHDTSVRGQPDWQAVRREG